MTAIKKTTAKASKSPAPATKSATPAAKTAASKSAAKKGAAATAAIVAAVTRAAAPVIAEGAAKSVKPVAGKKVSTTIQAKIDVGFGNTLSVRGEGAGLSWEQGKLMTCVENDLWQVTLPESARPVTFKFLINDVTWSTGADYTVASGSTTTFTPEF